jgi:hypothetical protein
MIGQYLSNISENATVSSFVKKFRTKTRPKIFLDPDICTTFNELFKLGCAIINAGQLTLL